MGCPQVVFPEGTEQACVVNTACSSWAGATLTCGPPTMPFNAHCSHGTSLYHVYH